MSELSNYSLYGMSNAYYNHMKEHYNNPQQQQVSNIVGMTFGFFVVMFLASVAIWILGLFLMIKYWKVLPSWARALSLIGILPIFPFGPVITIVVVLIAIQN